jgi:hypothetical protein
MTADVTLLLPMLGASFMAMLAPTLMRDPPIYDSLRERTLALAKISERKLPNVAQLPLSR